MRASPRLASLAFVALLAAGSPARGQEPIITYPPGVYSITTPAATTIERGPGFVTFRWGASPAPVPPVVPPTPTPDAVPTIAGHAWAVVLYDANRPLTADQAAAIADTVGAATAYDISLTAEPTDGTVGKSWAASGKVTRPLPAILIIQKNAAGAAAIAHQAAMPEDAPSFATLFSKLRGKTPVHAAGKQSINDLLESLRTKGEND
jgi:hypothetical protein